MNAYDDGNNTWNTSKTPGTNIIGGSWFGGNYWGDYAGGDTNDDGLGDSLPPYTSSGNIVNSGDWLPLVKTEKTPAEFTDVYSDYGEDTNGDGLFDYLVIDIGVAVQESGKYSLSGQLYENGTDNYVDYDSNTTNLNEGTQTIQLLFEGIRIWNNEYKGTYDLRYLYLYDANYPLPPLPKPPYLVVTADPVEIEADGSSTSVINASAWIWDTGCGMYLRIWAVPWVSFNTTLGAITESAQIINGSATALLTAGNVTGTAIVKAEVEIDDALITNTTEVAFIPPGTGGGAGVGRGSSEDGTVPISKACLAPKATERIPVASGEQLDYRYYAYTTSFYNYTDFQIPVEPTEQNFDTKASKNPYPSLCGAFNGVITPSCNLTVCKLYTYPCPGTSGHTESVKIWNSRTGWNVTATWNGYTDDWHNLTFNNSFTLYANETYNYTIVAGSYPQIIHESSWNATGGKITCTEFVDSNGQRHEGWIPAIRLY